MARHGQVPPATASAVESGYLGADTAEVGRGAVVEANYFGADAACIYRVSHKDSTTFIITLRYYLVHENALFLYSVLQLSYEHVSIVSSIVSFVYKHCFKKYGVQSNT